jgi:glycosyltransferase involved in cell wall biosynthesis
VASILGQSLGDFELLAIDDGSTDRSPEILADFARRDARLIWQRQPNAGYLHALNKMLDAARGVYVARMDADDVALPERFARQAAFLDAHPAHAMVGSAVAYIDEDGDELFAEALPLEHAALEANLLRGVCGICHPAAMIRRQSLLDVGGYRPECYGAEDQDVWLRLAERGRLANLPEVLLQYRIHSENFTFLHHQRSLDKLRWVLEDAHRRRGLAPPADVLAGVPQPTSAWDRRRTSAWGAIHAGHYAAARKHARRVLRERWTARASWVLLAYAYLGPKAEHLRRLLGRTVVM